MKHVFVSYIHENRALVERLCTKLKAAGIDVWLDRDGIKPGMRWELAIRDAIKDGAYFIACFSKESNARTGSYMNEELSLAMEQLRQRPANRIWFIPVLLNEGGMPSRPTGAGDDLQAFQWVELYKDWNSGMERILSVIEPSAVARPTSFANPIDGTSLELVPGGTYDRVKGRKAIQDRGPLGSMKIPDFYMSLSPVTNSQYGLFLKNTAVSFRNQPWFNAKTTENARKPQDKSDIYPPDHWVGGVGYNGVEAYCKWVRMRLPSVFELEYYASQLESGKEKKLVEGINHAWYKNKPFHWTSTKGREIGHDCDFPTAMSLELGTFVVDGSHDEADFDFGFRCVADVQMVRNIFGDSEGDLHKQ